MAENGGFYSFRCRQCEGFNKTLYRKTDGSYRNFSIMMDKARLHMQDNPSHVVEVVSVSHYTIDAGHGRGEYDALLDDNPFRTWVEREISRLEKEAVTDFDHGILTAYRHAYLRTVPYEDAVGNEKFRRWIENEIVQHEAMEYALTDFSRGVLTGLRWLKEKLDTMR